MRHLLLVIGLTAALCACAGTEPTLEARAGTNVTLERRDGVQMVGRLVSVDADTVVMERRGGEPIAVPRAEVKSVREAIVPQDGVPAPVSARENRAVGDPGADQPATTPPGGGDAAAGTTGDSGATKGARRPEYREVTLPAGTVLPVALRSPVGSDTSHVEDHVRGALRHAVTVRGVEVLPAGTVVSGHVTNAKRSARVKGRGTVAFRFTTIDPPGAEGRQAISTATITRVAPATKKQDAAKIGGAAVGGAILGGILGGGSGAAKGAAIGGGAGTAVVMSTRGKEVRLGEGAPLSVRLTAPLTVHVRS